MDWTAITRIIAILGLAAGALGILYRLDAIMRRPFRQDLARPRGATGRGILYAFTLGMAPWEKESTRLHWVAYLRGVIFHIGIFSAFAVLFASPWLASWPAVLRWAAFAITALGGLAGLGGVALRWMDANVRSLSLPDDYFAVILASLFVLTAALILVLPAGLPWFYLLTALLAVYVPFGKIRHCVYFFYSKFFFGLSFGRRGVIGQARGKYSE